MKKLTTILAMVMVGVFLVAGSAMGFSFGTSWDKDPITKDPISLQSIFDANITGGTLDANNYSGVTSWQPSEATVDSYLITMVKADKGVLGLYSTNTGAEYDLMTEDGNQTTTSFGVNDFGALYINGVLSDDNFGNEFGFYWKNTSNALMSYTNSKKNAAGLGYGDADENFLALSYLVNDGLSVKTQLMGGTTVDAKGNDDWILAFEDRAKSNGDGDFNDAVFYIEDMKPVPEPTTMLLLGSGLLGMGAVTRRKKSKK